MELIERHTQLSELQVALRTAETGHGGMVLVTGESGAGKTALVRQFCTAQTHVARLLWGMCDEFITPRPLGPFRDIAAQLSNGTPSSLPVLDTVIGKLDGRAGTSIVVIEDAHWADDATLDALRFLGRRVARMRVLVVVTFRDDEMSADHPLRRALGVIPPDDIRRVTLPPLSRAGVAALAGRDDVTALFKLTDGNPFYVTEMLATPDIDVPHSVQDAVMSRVSRLSSAGRDFVETAAVMPGRAEKDVLIACAVDRIDEAVQMGVVHTERNVVTFSHELVRRAIEHGLPPARRRALNHRVLDVLAANGADPARLAHHAVESDDTVAIVEHAPVAARLAASLDAHREAASHYAQALRYPEELDDKQLANLLQEYAHECFVIGRHRDSADALLRAADRYRSLGDVDGLGGSLALLSDVQWYLGQGAEARASTSEAISVLSKRPPSANLARGYAQQAKLALVNQRPREAVDWGDRAIQLARDVGDIDVEIHALNTVGSAEWTLPPYDNRRLVESLELALTERRNKAAGRAYFNIVSSHLANLELDDATRRLEEGLAFCHSHDLVSIYDGFLVLRAIVHFERGRWSDAHAEAQASAATPGAAMTSALILLARYYCRTGDDRAPSALEAARECAERLGDTQDVLPVRLIDIESAWLRGDDIGHHARELFRMAELTGSRARLGETALWMRRAGLLDETPATALEPFALHVAGKWEAAAKAWAARGCAYAEADALADSTSPEALIRALEILFRLGAKPRAALVRQRLDELGVTHIPRGPRAAARANPAGLTPRQTEILGLLAKDLTYQQIAQRLHLSHKTVDHHASAVRTKLDASTRAEAVAAARELGILDVAQAS